jgi:hypothetical protein
LAGKPEGKGPLGKTGRGWENNIKMDLQEVGIDLAQNKNRWLALENGLMIFGLPKMRDIS